MRKQRRRESPARWLRLRRRTLLVDAGSAAAAVLVELLFTLLLPVSLRDGRDATAVALTAVCATPIVLRRAAPWTAVLGCVAVLTVATVAAVFTVSHALSFAVVSYTTASRFALRPAVAANLLLWLPAVFVGALVGAESSGVDLPRTYVVLNNVLTALVLFFLGRAVYGQRMSTRVLRERALAAETNQRALAVHAVTDERRRIARELHDVVAHHVSVIGVLAAGGRRVLHRDPDAADEALRTIADTSRTTLREMRRLLDVLRTDEDPDAQLTPQPGLAGIEALVEQVREAGLPVVLEVQGEAVRLETGVGLTVYRIVQEALTNALKHAGTATAAVRLCFDAGGLTVQVSDTGRGPAPYAGTGVGHGLVGMRERVALYGGTLRTGERPGGGFTVDARIPADQLGTDT